MTADRAALVEKVGRLLWYDGSGFDVPNHLLTAAIHLIRNDVLEEAAKVAAKEPWPWGKSAAAAIRALKDKP